MKLWNTEILCTLGPASFNPWVIERLEELGVGIFRINLSHTKANELSKLITDIQACTDVPICLDTEGAQIRTGDFSEERIELVENSVVLGFRECVEGGSDGFNFYPAKIVDVLQVGDFISIDFNSVLVQVTAQDADGVAMRVINGGMIGRNKAVTVDREILLDPLTENDRESLAIGRRFKLRHFALSFASCRDDVELIRTLTDEGAFIISKIESLAGLSQLSEIAEASDALLIDRGDLSRQVPLERIPEVQKAIISTAKGMDRKVYVATNLLESMINLPSPTRAEVNDVYNTLVDGADGLVLAAETAIGAYPIECASMIVKLIRNFESPEKADPLEFPSEPISLLVEPHGGRLVQRHASDAEREQVTGLPRLVVSDTTLLDCEQITHGTYSPVSGFMGRQTCMGVLRENRLPDGTIWTMPILLPVPDPDDVINFGPGDRVALSDQGGAIYATIDVSEIFSMDLDTLAASWFGTSSINHPGVARLFAQGNRFVAGEVSLIRRLPSPYRHYELTPVQSRFVFAHKGWSRVIGFHTRNPVHRGHEYIQLRALRETGADGLYINPVIGPKKLGDFMPGPIMLSYRTILDAGIYPKGRVVLGSFASYSRYAGPREAIFTALCRKNMGCSHFIIGRDHTGVGSYYAAGAVRSLMDDLGDCGIEPVFFDTVGYDAGSGLHGIFDETEDVNRIDGTHIRNALRDGEAVPDWMMREVVQDVLRNECGQSLFVE